METPPRISLPPRLQEVIDEFAAVPPELRVEVLVEYAGRVPDLPERFTGSAALERVEECQTPFFLTTEVGDDDRVRLWFDCPPHAPTQRAFAGILHAGLDGATVEEILAVPQDLPDRLGLAEAISALRLRGFHAILARLQRQVRLVRSATELAR